MITDSTVLFAPRSTVDSWLGMVLKVLRNENIEFKKNEHPIVAQLGGNTIDSLTHAAEIVASYGYDEINLNVGCPSPRVSGRGCFGAALMKKKELVRDIVYALKRKLNVPVSIKHRLGVDELDSYEYIKDFIATVKESGCDHYIVHARKAWLKGVNTKQNRNIPPLHYDRVFKLQRDFPDLKFSINGGFKTLESVKSALSRDPEIGVELTGGVMIGRTAYEDPVVIAKVDTEIYGEPKNPETCKTRRILLENYAAYIDDNAEKTKDVNVCILVKPILGLFHGHVGSKVYRNALSNTWQYGEFDVDQGETQHAKLIHHVIKVMEDANPTVLDEVINE
ncbi:bifunctional DUS-like [Babesia duncani]|uniref:Bifunctional DUS-like n=1 Tax=Babesia duncani TaxID=323732 RepID=A0AAD9PGP4_9APIC|nr:bifunctional DUS-like [Babesia duncani]KAK2194708.1 bifunctional DUS-like [Babesia duncani]KAK2197554.1 bifunctional DUS-like [Babesia duncani]